MANDGYFDSWGGWHSYSPPDMGNAAAHTPIPRVIREAEQIATESTAEAQPPVDACPQDIAPPEAAMQPPDEPPVDPATGWRLFIRQMRARLDQDRPSSPRTPLKRGASAPGGVSGQDAA